MNALKLLPFVIALALAGCGEKTPETTEQPEASAPVVEQTPAPAAEAPAEAPAAPEAAAPEAAAPEATAAAGTGDLVKGEQVYGSSCVACHGSGVMGAPKLGDKAAWEPRLAKGKDTLYVNSIKGINMMPAKGGNPALSDEDTKAAVDFMLSKVS